MWVLVLISMHGAVQTPPFTSLNYCIEAAKTARMRKGDYFTVAKCTDMVSGKQINLLDEKII